MKKTNGEAAPFAARHLILSLLLTLSGITFAAPGDLIQSIPNPDSETGAKFGYSVDGVNGHVLAGAPFYDAGGATNSGIAYRITPAGSLVYRLHNPIPTNNDNFGWSIEGFEKHILVGAPYDEVLHAATGGAVHLFRGSDGNLLRAIASPAPENNARFGWSVHALKGKFVAGAPNDEGANEVSQAGAAYLLNKGSKNSNVIKPRNPKSTFLSPRPDPNDEFGYSVSALKNTVLVGAPGDDEGASNAGAAFQFFARTARLEQIYNNPEPDQDDRFGFSVAVIEDDVDGSDDNDEPQIAIGAPDDETTDGVQAGRVFVFDSASGNLQFIIENPEPETGDRFGWSIHNVGGNILVGAPGEDSNIGIAYLFNGQTGALITTLNNPDPDGGDEFGFAVTQVVTDLRGADDRHDLLVGAPGDEVDGEPSAGSVYLFSGLE